MEGGSARRKAATNTGQHKHRRTQTSVHQVAFEPMIPVSERAKAVNAQDRAATVIGHHVLKYLKTLN
jgi:hypothetical protein